CSPTSRPAGTTLTKPFGTPTWASTSAIIMAASVVSSECVTTMEQPASSAGASFDMVTNCGTFQGTIAPTTPTPSLRTITSLPSTPCRFSSQSNSLATWMKVVSIIHGAGVWASWENEIGEPISSVMTAAMSIICAAYNSANFDTHA